MNGYIESDKIQILKFVPETNTINQLFATKKVKMLELIDEDGEFLRHTFHAIKEPEPPNFEWILQVTPNKQERTTIT
mgnify:FL=1